MKKTVIILLFLQIQANLFAQTNYVHYTVKDGLPQMQCMVLFQDSKGYIWVGTKGGVSRYDGNTFKNYSKKQHLLNNRIYKISEDNKGNIWVLTQNGLSKLSGDSFVNFPVQKGKILIDSDLVIDQNNHIWLTEGYPAKHLVAFMNGTYQNIFTCENNLSLCHLSYNKNNDQLYFSANDTINNYRYVVNQRKVNLLSKSDEDYYINYNERLAFKYKYGNKKIITKMYHVQNADTMQVYSNHFSIQFPKRLNDSTIVFSTTKFSVDMPMYYIANGKLQENPQHFDYINDILVDTENNVWVASEKGLYKLTPFNNFAKKDNMLNYVWSIVEDDSGKIWFSSYGNAFLHYFQAHKMHKYPKKFTNKGFFFGAIKTSDGTLVFPNEKGVYNYRNGTFSLDTLFNSSAVLSVFEDTLTDKKYFGSFKGLVIKEKDGKMHLNSRFVKEKDNLVMAMHKNQKGELWYVTRNAFGILNQRDTLAMHNDKLKGAMCLYIDYKDNLWIGSDSGLFMYDYKKVRQVFHPELQTMIGAITQIDTKHFVYGGLRGIGIFDVEKFYDSIELDSINATINAEIFVDYYSQSNGFMGEEIGQVGIFKDSKGRVWVPTNNNVVMFNPDDLVKNKKPPYTYITGFSVSKDNTNWMTRTDSLKSLSHSFSNIRFDFTGISYTAPEMVRYKYRLIGFNNSWHKPTRERYVTYTNLPYGKYTFELLARNNNNVWNDTPVHLSFEILPAWWQTVWFKVLFSLIVLVSVFGLFLMFYSHKIKKMRLEDRMSKLQLQSIQSQLYPHLLFNAVSAAGSVIYKEEKDKAYDFVVKLSKFIRQALTDTKKMYKSLQEELDFVDAYLQLQKIRFSERFDYETSIDPQVDLNFQIPQMTIQTYVENAVKHGLEPLKQNGMLYIRVNKTSNGIRIVVQDNGVGIRMSEKISEKSTGIGIKIMNEIYDIHNQKNKCKITFKLVDLFKYEGEGTQSIIEIVCDKNDKQ